MRYLKKYNFIWALPVIAIYVYTRWKYLGEISYYMHVDEMKAAFDSMVLAGYGSDSFDKLPSLYVLLGALLMKLKGGLFSLKLFRLISVAGGLFCMIFSSLLVKEITGKERYAFLEAVLITTLPFFFISERTGVSDYLLVEIAPAAFYFLIKGILGILLLNSNYYHIYYHKVNLSYIHHTLILRIMNLYYQSHLMYLLITLMDIINYCKLLFYMVYAMYAYCLYLHLHHHQYLLF